MRPTQSWPSPRHLSALPIGILLVLIALAGSVVFSDEQFEHGPMSASPLVTNILQEGLAA